MRPMGWLALATVGLLASSAGLLAGDPVFRAGDGAKEKAALTPRAISKIRGPEVKKAVDKVLAEVHWHRDLSHALALAAEEKKPVFWLQLVGELDDGL